MERTSTGYWMKLNEAAYNLGLSEVTLRRRIKAGQLKHELKDGRYYVFLKEKEDGEYIIPSINSSSEIPEFKRTFENTSAQYEVNKDTFCLKEKIDSLNEIISAKDAEIKRLKRELEDQATLISFLEQQITD